MRNPKIWLMTQRAIALHEFLQHPEGIALLQGYRRAVNIVELEEKKNRRVKGLVEVKKGTKKESQNEEEIEKRLEKTLLKSVILLFSL